MPEYGGMTLARVKRFLELSGADREAVGIVNNNGIHMGGENPDGSQGHSRCAPHASPVDQMHGTKLSTSHIQCGEAVQQPA